MNPYEIVGQFEQEIAKYTGSPYAVALDNCSAAIFLACKYLKVSKVIIPARTYVSVPCSIIHAGGVVEMEDISWEGAYQLKPYLIWDCACRFRKNMYIGGYCCLSFESRKHLPIGRGGMILTDDKDAVKWFKLARFHGRHEIPLMEDEPEMIGWNFYMEPERAARGLALLTNAKDDNLDLTFEYPDLRIFKIYNS